MGRQFTFIADKKDTEAFIEFVSKTGVVLFKDRFEGIIEVNSRPNVYWTIFYFYKEEFGELRFLVSRGKKYISTLDSPVIEFSETSFQEHKMEIIRGRLFVEMKFYDEHGKLIIKDKSLSNWYSELVNWLKQRLVHIDIFNGENITKEYVSESLVHKLKNSNYRILG